MTLKAWRKKKNVKIKEDKKKKKAGNPIWWKAPTSLLSTHHKLPDTWKQIQRNPLRWGLLHCSMYVDWLTECARCDGSSSSEVKVFAYVKCLDGFQSYRTEKKARPLGRRRNTVFRLILPPCLASGMGCRSMSAHTAREHTPDRSWLLLSALSFPWLTKKQKTTKWLKGTWCFLFHLTRETTKFLHPEKFLEPRVPLPPALIVHKCSPRWSNAHTRSQQASRAAWGTQATTIHSLHSLDSRIMIIKKKKKKAKNFLSIYCCFPHKLLLKIIFQIVRGKVLPQKKQRNGKLKWRQLGNCGYLLIQVQTYGPQIFPPGPTKTS